MIRLLFVGDGERDAVTVPRLVERILDTSVQEVTRVWARLHSAGKGYGRKLTYALRQARHLRATGIVATLDRDKERRGKRLAKLKRARTADRKTAPPFPTALGEAVPHGEAWLLADAHAVRQAMRLPGDTPVPSVRSTKDPKRALQTLLTTSPRANERPLQVLAEVARLVDTSRCTHRRATGFASFVKDVETELRPLAGHPTE